MKFGPKRGHPLYIFNDFFRNFGALLLALFYVVLRGPQALLENVWIIVIVVLGPFGRLVGHLTTFYSIEGDSFLVKSGLFNKKKLEVPLSTITTVDLTQSLLQRIFGVYKLKVSNNSSVSGGGEGKLTAFFKDEEAFLLKRLLLSRGGEPLAEERDPCLLSKKEILSTSEDTRSIGSGAFFLRGLLQSKAGYLIAMLSIVVLLSQMAGDLQGFLHFDEAQMGEMARDLILANLYLAGAFLLLFSYLIATVYSVLSTVARYYNFRITNRKDAILVEYGLFTRKSHTLSRKKISGIRFRQSFLMRLTGFGALEVLAVGVGEGDGGVAVLHPLLRKRDLAEFTGALLPEMTLEGTYAKAKPGALHYFFYTFRFVFCLFLFLGTLIAWRQTGIGILPALGVFFLILAMVSVLLEYGNSGLFANAQVIGMTCGGFGKKAFFIKTGKLEWASKKGTLWKERRGFGTIEVGFLGPRAACVVKVRNLENGPYEELSRLAR